MSRSTLGCCLVLAATVAFARPAFAAAAATENPYAAKTDAELTGIAADWESLAEDQRRALLTEMRGRMEANKQKGESPVIAVRTQRRYGRLVRQPDGSVVRVETTEQVVQYRTLPAAGEATPPADRAFGVGFERRVGAESEGTDRTPPPAPEDAPGSGPAKPVLVDHAGS